LVAVRRKHSARVRCRTPRRARTTFPPPAQVR